MAGLKWTQKTKDQEWYKVTNNTDNTGNGSALTKYAGKYQPKGNAYFEFTIGVDNDHLTGNLENEGKVNLYFNTEDYFVLKNGEYWNGYRFIKNNKGEVIKVIVDQHGAVECVRVSPQPIGVASSKHNFYKRTNFTHADTLLGRLSPLRNCYDVLFYHLDLTVFPASKSIKGSNLIRFKSINDFDEMQVDLFANMTINKIVYHDRELTYKRDGDAVFIKLPYAASMGTIGEIKIFYEGVPQALDLQIAHSGWIWFQDRNEKPWIESVSQGSGASLWWPCKDHLSEKPDSMELSVTVPKGLMEISNGKLISKTELPGNKTRFDWYVSYPINNYNPVIYIGDYTHFSGVDVTDTDSLDINYYCLKDNLEKARSFFANVKPTLNLYEKSFGTYPFKKDGFSLVEAPYPMEHQGAVSMGSIYSPPNSNQFDSASLINTLWHEMAHEWWGNNVTCKDYADFWIHESFATYAELLARKNLLGKEAYQKVIKDTRPVNKEPVIGFYDVNDFHMGMCIPKEA
ncbi:MAG: M1 family metallopeptidase [Chitinophagaceae bacterium]|nr:M1 family metallopeptidase [Chitinophagaceae bacterium]